VNRKEKAKRKRLVILLIAFLSSSLSLNVNRWFFFVIFSSFLFFLIYFQANRTDEVEKCDEVSDGVVDKNKVNGTASQ
jgi:hypothetical protein